MEGCKKQGRKVAGNNAGRRIAKPPYFYLYLARCAGQESFEPIPRAGYNFYGAGICGVGAFVIRLVAGGPVKASVAAVYPTFCKVIF